MEEITCENCHVVFSNCNTPKVLNCGHSFCNECIFKIWACKTVDSRTCPVCHLFCSNEVLVNPPTNYSLVRSLKRNEKHLHILECIASRVTAIKALLSNTKEKLNVDSIFYKYIDNNIDKIDELTTYEMLDLINNPFNSVKLASQSNVQIVLQLNDFKYAQYFPSTITDFLKEGYAFYTAYIVHNKMMYGKLSVDAAWPDILFMHSWTETEIEKGANIIWGHDLKYCINNYSDAKWTFIEIPNKLTTKQKIVFIMEDEHLSCVFVDICIGENGASFRGLPYSIEILPNSVNVGKLSVDGFIFKGLWSAGGIVCNCNAELYVRPKLSQDKDSFVLQSLIKGGFNIFKCEANRPYVNIIGKMHTFCSNWTTILGKSEEEIKAKIIIDCGVALPIPKPT